MQGGPGFNQISMLGLTAVPSRTSDTSDRSLVAVYLDDTPISVQGQTPDLRVYDLDRVEILRGPQGTLYGDSSMAGTVRYITAKPSANSTFGTFETTGSETEHGSPSYSYRAMFNTPIIEDKLAFRGTLYDGQDGGYINNIGDHNKKDANLNNSLQARGALRWTPDSSLTVDFSVTFEQSHANGLNDAWSGLPKYEIATNGPEGTRDSFQLYQLNIDKDLGFANLVSSTAYTWRRIGFQQSTEPTIGYYFANYDGLPNALYNAPASYTRPSTTRSRPNATASTTKSTTRCRNSASCRRTTVRSSGQSARIMKTSSAACIRTSRSPVSTPTPMRPAYTSRSTTLIAGTIHRRSTAASIRTTFSPACRIQTPARSPCSPTTPGTSPNKLDLTAGVRYFNYNESYYLFEGGVYGAINHAPLTENRRKRPAASIRASTRPTTSTTTPWSMAEAAKGFRYGGANQPVPTATPAAATGNIPQKCLYDLQQYGYSSAPLTFGPDSLWDYTVGEKAKLDGGRMTFNADAYYIDWSSVQTRLLLNCSYFFTESGWRYSQRRPGAGDDLQADAVGDDRRQHRLEPVARRRKHSDRGRLDGDESPYSPNWIVSGFIYYDKQVADGMMHLSANYQYRSEENTNFDPSATSYNATTGVLTKTGPNALFATIPSSNDVNMSASYDFGRYEVESSART